MFKLVSVSLFALVLAATLSTDAHARGRRHCSSCPNNCTPSVAAGTQAVPMPDAQASAPTVVGTRSMSVAPSTAPTTTYYAPVRYSYTRTPSYLIPKSDFHRFSSPAH
ncbi:MAG: hypothetical protein JNL96_21900 [Planctomycetaceae bacterium]|nr:hypothetical protein [Planctomycetaceae bacterium]